MMLFRKIFKCNSTNFIVKAPGMALRSNAGLPISGIFAIDHLEKLINLEDTIYSECSPVICKGHWMYFISWIFLEGRLSWKVL